MAEWAKALGVALGGDSEEAYQEGRFMGARTEEALAKARESVDKATAMSRAEKDFTALGMTPAQARAAATSLQAGAGIKDPIEALLKGQEYGFNERIADPNVPLDEAQRLVLTKSTNPVEPLYKIGGGYGNKFDSAAGIKPLGAASGSEGGGNSAAMQYLTAAGAIDSTTGQIRPGWEKFAWRVQNPQMRVVKINGVDTVITDNPWEGVPGQTPPAAGAPPAAAAAAPPLAAAPPAPTVRATPLSSTDEALQFAQSEAAAKEQGQAIGRNAAGLQSTLTTIDKFTTDIDNFLNQPGFDNLYGNLQGTEVGKTLGGLADQDISNARAAQESLGGEAFLASIQKMRGFGQLSNQEGAKVQTALTRALDTRIGSPEARAAWAEVKKHMAELKRVAAIEAGRAQAPAAPAAPAAGETKVFGGKKYVKMNGQWYEDDGT